MARVLIKLKEDSEKDLLTVSYGDAITKDTFNEYNEDQLDVRDYLKYRKYDLIVKPVNKNTIIEDNVSDTIIDNEITESIIDTVITPKTKSKSKNIKKKKIKK